MAGNYREYTMAEGARCGVTLFCWKSDGKLHKNPDGTLGRMTAVGMAGSDIDAGEIVRVGFDGVIRRLIYNPCGRLHLGRVLITERGMFCSTCQDRVDEDERRKIYSSFRQVREIIDKATGRKAK